MSTVFIVLIIIIAAFLILVSALQSSQKEGLGNALGSGVHQVMGVKKTSDLLEQVTWGLLMGLFIMSALATLYLKKNATHFSSSPNLEHVQQEIGQPEYDEPVATKDAVPEATSASQEKA